MSVKTNTTTLPVRTVATKVGHAMVATTYGLHPGHHTGHQRANKSVVASDWSMDMGGGSALGRSWRNAPGDGPANGHQVLFQSSGLTCVCGCVNESGIVCLYTNDYGCFNVFHKTG